jgi:hypothetical protein
MSEINHENELDELLHEADELNESYDRLIENLEARRANAAKININEAVDVNSSNVALLLSENTPPH